MKTTIINSAILTVAFSLLVSTFAPLSSTRAQDSDEAQPRTRNCGAPEPTSTDLTKVRKLVARSVAKGKAPTGELTVHIVWNRITDGPRGKVSNDAIRTQMEVLNRAYAGSGFRFVLDSIRDTNNKAWFRMGYGSKEESKAKQKLSVTPAKVLNVYSAAPPGLLGWSTFPWRGAARQQGVVVHFASLPGGKFQNYNLGNTLVHEVGHFCGLFHTFQNGCDAPGDEVDDTPHEELPATGCDTGRDTCPLQAGMDPIHNFMDYSDDPCMNQFTPGQSERMRLIMQSYRPRMLNPKPLAGK